jgi:WD40 repeat protein
VNARRLPAALAVALLWTAAGLAADDAYGDPLPEGAKLRLGTARLRNTNGIPSAITPDGKFLVAAKSGGGTAYIDPATGKVERTLRIESPYSAPSGFSADGKRGIVSGYTQPFVFDTETGKTLAKVGRNTPSSDASAALSADGKRLAVGGMKGFDPKDKDKPVTAVVWDVDANKELALVTPGPNETVLVALSGSGKVLATWGFHYDRTAKQPLKPEDNPGQQVRFWDAETGKPLAKVTLATGNQPSAVALSPDGSVAAVAPGDGTIHLFDPATGRPKGLLLGRSRQGRKLAFGADGKTLAAGADDGWVQTWSVADGKRLATTAPPVPLVSAPKGLQFTADDRLVAWTQRDMTAVAWEVPSGKLLTPAGGHWNPLAGAALPAGGKEYFTGSTDGVILRWDAATGKELGSLSLKVPTASFAPAVAGLSPDGARALSFEGGNTLAVYDLPGCTQQFVIPGDLLRGSRGSFTADGSKVVQVMPSYDPKTPAGAAVWDVASAKKLGAVELPGVRELTAALSPDGKTLITAGVVREGKVRDLLVVTGWELATGKKLGEYSEPGVGFGTVAIAVAGDNKSAVVMSPREGPIVVDVAAGKKTRALEGATVRTGVAPVVSPDGKTVAIATGSARAGYSVVLIDIESGKVNKTLPCLTSAPNVLAFSPDGKTLLAGCADTTALVWDVAGR